MLLPFAERSIEGRESNEERADLPHRVLDSLPRTLHLSPISHGPRDAFGCGGGAGRGARGGAPGGAGVRGGALADGREERGGVVARRRGRETARFCEGRA